MMSKYLRVILMIALVVTLLAGAATVAGARTSYTTSKPALSNAPRGPGVHGLRLHQAQVDGVEPRHRQDHPVDEVRDRLGRHGHVLGEAVDAVVRAAPSTRSPSPSR